MGNYLDKAYAAVDNVLIHYSGNDASLTIPERLANMTIHSIGDGAFMQSKSLKFVNIPRGIRRIGKRAFSGCENLEKAVINIKEKEIDKDAFYSCSKLTNINFLEFELSAQSYMSLLSSSEPANGKMRFSYNLSDNKILENAEIHIMPAVYINNGIKRLFVLHDYNEKGIDSMNKARENYNFHGDEFPISETDAFMELIKSDNDCETDKETEEKNDLFLHDDYCPLVYKTPVFTFNDSKTATENDRYCIDINVSIAYHFWQSKVPVRYNGKNYYVYRRNYLSPDDDLKYVRIDTAIFSENGLVTNQKEAQEVYAKYKLLSTL